MDNVTKSLVKSHLEDSEGDEGTVLRCEIWSFHSFEESDRTFRRSMMPSSSGWRWRHHGSPTTLLHCVTTQKTTTWII